MTLNIFHPDRYELVPVCEVLYDTPVQAGRGYHGAIREAILYIKALEREIEELRRQRNGGDPMKE